MRQEGACTRACIRGRRAHGRRPAAVPPRSHLVLLEALRADPGERVVEERRIENARRARCDRRAVDSSAAGRSPVECRAVSRRAVSRRAFYGHTALRHRSCLLRGVPRVVCITLAVSARHLALLCLWVICHEPAIVEESIGPCVRQHAVRVCVGGRARNLWWDGTAPARHMYSKRSCAGHVHTPTLTVHPVVARLWASGTCPRRPPAPHTPKFGRRGGRRAGRQEGRGTRPSCSWTARRAARAPQRPSR